MQMHHPPYYSLLTAAGPFTTELALKESMPALLWIEDLVVGSPGIMIPAVLGAAIGTAVLIWRHYYISKIKNRIAIYPWN